MLQMSQGRLLSLSSDPVGSSGFSVPSPSACRPPDNSHRNGQGDEGSEGGPEGDEGKEGDEGVGVFHFEVRACSCAHHCTPALARGRPRVWPLPWWGWRSPAMDRLYNEMVKHRLRSNLTAT